VAHGLWHEQFFIDIYSFALAGVGLFLIYKEAFLQFLTTAHLKGLKFGSSGISLEFYNQLEKLVQETDNTQGEGQMVYPMTAHQTNSKMPPPPDPHKFVAAPAQHKHLVSSLSQSMSALKTALVGDRECLLVEAIFLAAQDGRIDQQTKDLMLKLTGTLTTINQFPNFITSGQILMMQYICDKLRERIKVDR
jgi:hypothetical protein